MFAIKMGVVSISLAFTLSSSVSQFVYTNFAFKNLASELTTHTKTCAGSFTENQR